MTEPNNPADKSEDQSFADKAKGAAASAQEKVSAAASATVEKAKENPYAAAGIVAGVAAAVAGAAYGATKLRENGDQGDADKA